MTKKFIKNTIGILFLAIIISSSFYFAAYSQADTAGQDLKNQLNNAAAPGWGGTPAGNTSLSGIIAVVIQALLGMLGIIFLVLIIYAGFNWMTAQGDEEKVTLAKNTLTRAIIGLVIIVLAYAITFFVFNALPGETGSGTNSNIVGGS